MTALTKLPITIDIASLLEIQRPVSNWGTYENRFDVIDYVSGFPSNILIMKPEMTYEWTISNCQSQGVTPILTAVVFKFLNLDSPANWNDIFTLGSDYYHRWYIQDAKSNNNITSVTVDTAKGMQNESPNVRYSIQFEFHDSAALNQTRYCKVDPLIKTST